MKPASAEPKVLGEASLACVHHSVARARSEVRVWLGSSHPAIDDVVLATSELVTNAITHSDSAPGDFIGLTVTEAKGIVYVEVTDAGSGASGPQIRKDPDAKHGRGLLIVREISLDWGTREHGYGLGRTVWCAIGLASSSDALSVPESVSNSEVGAGPGDHIPM
jgi:anti-sigma regulatory factor (Ser/Thr protein kinase)